MSSFQHPHAVAYIDSSASVAASAAASKEQVGPVLVMEYLRGVDLNLLFQREGRFTPERVGRLLAQLCDVLQAAHDAGIVHRDVKPGNLMIMHPGTPQEQVKLMDFGLAKMSSMFYISPEEVVQFRLPAASGTPEYIAPEMVRGNDQEAKGDLYSVGVILFELLAGRRPFVSNSVEELMLAHRDDAPPTFAEVGVTDVPPAVEAVVRDCLSKVPDLRPRTAWDLATAYERALGRRITSGRAVTKESPTRGAGQVPRLTGGAESPSRAIERGVMRKDFESNMPEAMALLKLKGFIYDLGGEVVESVPGMIRVRLAEEGEQKTTAGLLPWSTRKAAVAAPPPLELELHMERKNPAQPGLLTITLVIRPNGRPNNVEWTNRCNQINQDLQAYLMGR
jgi:serine/threonine-protein kinase